jgi:predicted ribosomally synthesized peptide with nif11-like leader
MSTSELARLEADLKDNPDLRREVADLHREPVQLAQWARRHGYELTPAQVRQLLGSPGELSDDDLEQVAGGDDPWSTSGGTGNTGGTGG